MPAEDSTGVVAGTITCYAGAGEDWTFFEINPAIIAIARARPY
jgi:hypothetical protein